MGKVQSIFKVRGKVGDFVFYQLNGKAVMRKVAAKKKGAKTKAQLKVVKQNTEFGAASSAGKFLREALPEECKSLQDRYLYQRVAKLMMAVKAYDPAAEGTRTVEGGLATAEGASVLAGFQFHKKSGNFPRILKAEKRGDSLELRFSQGNFSGVKIIELQLDFSNGKFRRVDHVLPEREPGHTVTLKQAFRRKKGFTDLVFVWGEKFLQGVVVDGSEKD